MTTTVVNTKISEVENKIPHNSKYITTEEFNKLTVKNFAARLKQANLVNKTDFNNKEVQKKLNSLITKDYNVFFGRIYFTSNDGSQNTFVYEPTLDALELKKDRC